MAPSKKKIQVLYRNYIPLNSPYSSFWTAPPGNIEFLIPPPRKFLRHLYPIYNQWRDNRAVRLGIRVAQSLLFTRAQSLPAADGYFFVGMIPDEPMKAPYYIDIEHASALFNFVASESTDSERNRIIELLAHQNCHGVVPISHAAQRSLRSYLGERGYLEIEKKIQVIYPSLPCYADQWHRPAKAPEDKAFRVLFVGNEPRRKGLYETLAACDRVANSEQSLELTAITRRTRLGTLGKRPWNLEVFDPKFSTEALMRRFMFVADAFIMPTYLDSFGMVILEAMSCGVPVIATNQFAIPEMIQDGEEGFLLKHPPLFVDREPPVIPARLSDYVLDSVTEASIIESAAKALTTLCCDAQLRKTMGEHGKRHFRPGGKFAIDTRNRALSKLFGVACEEG